MFNSFRWRLINALKSAETALSNDPADYLRIARYYIPFAITPYHKFEFEKFEKKTINAVKNSCREITLEDKKEIAGKLCDIRNNLPAEGFRRILYRTNPNEIYINKLDNSDTHVFFGTISRASIMATAALAYLPDTDGVFVVGGLYIMAKTIMIDIGGMGVVREKINNIRIIIEKYSQQSYVRELEKELGIGDDTYVEVNNHDSKREQQLARWEHLQESIKDAKASIKNDSHSVDMYPRNTYSDGREQDLREATDDLRSSERAVRST